MTNFASIICGIVFFIFVGIIIFTRKVPVSQIISGKKNIESFDNVVIMIYLECR